MQLNVVFIKSVLNVFEEMNNNGISLVYLGDFNHDITKMFTSMAEDKMDKKSEDKKIKKKVYHVMVETLQNMNKHSDEISDNDNIGNGLFMIGQKNSTYFVITLNKILNSKIESLESAIQQVNNATSEELKQMYLKQIKEGKLSEKGGAGLGLIDIARKTDGKHDYHFLPFNEDYSYFILKAEINAEKIEKVKVAV